MGWLEGLNEDILVKPWVKCLTASITTFITIIIVSNITQRSKHDSCHDIGDQTAAAEIVIRP